MTPSAGVLSRQLEELRATADHDVPVINIHMGELTAKDVDGYRNLGVEQLFGGAADRAARPGHFDFWMSYRPSSPASAKSGIAPTPAARCPLTRRSAAVDRRTAHG